MRIIRKIVFIIVLLWLAFVVYRFFDQEWADNLLSKITSDNINKVVESVEQEQIDEVIATWTLDEWNIISWENTITQTIDQNTNTWDTSTWSDIIIVDDMEWFSEIIDNQASIQEQKWDLNYKNTDYNFSIIFPSSREWYTIKQISSWWNIKEIIKFYFYDTDKSINKIYFSIYIVEKNYYQRNKSTEFSGFVYINQNSEYAFLYKMHELLDPKSKTVPYILKTFKLNNITTTSSQTTIQTNGSTTTTTQVINKKNTTIKSTSTKAWWISQQDINDAKSLFDSFIQ